MPWSAACITNTFESKFKNRKISPTIVADVKRFSH